MSDHDDPQHRAHHQPDPGRVHLREESNEDGVFSVRLPLASTGEVRNEGDDPLTRDEVEGMRTQLEERSVGVFLDHGRNMDVAGSRYSAVEKVGEWADPALEDNGGETELVANAVMMDPETLPAETGALREALSTIREQVKRDMSLASSIGWREDESFSGGVDLMEASIVGIPADPRTTSHGAAVAMARDVLAEAGVSEAERESLVEEFRAVVMGSDADDGREADDTVTDETDPSDEQSGDTTDESDGMDEKEYRESMLEMQRTQTETLNTLAEAVRQDDDEDEDEDDDDDGEDEDGDSDEEENEGDHDDEEDDDENDADAPDGTQSIDIDGDEVTADDVRELREQLADADAEVPDTSPDGEQDADGGDADGDTDTDAGRDGPDWRA